MLNVERTAIREVPSSIVHLHRLHSLKLSNCKRLQFLPALPENLEVLTADNCKLLQALPSDFLIFLINQGLRAEFLVVDWSNCFQLDQKKLSKIVNKVLQNIQRCETEWLKKAEIEGWKYPPLLCGGFSHKICYPGSEIPRWFDYRARGSSGSLPLPRGLLQNNLIGVVVCAIVTFEDFMLESLHDDSLWCFESFESEDDELHLYDYHLCCDWIVNANCGQFHLNSKGSWDAGILPYVNSDHVTLCYKMGDNILGEGFDESLYNNQVRIRFSTSRNCLMVKEWGIHFLYRQDFGLNDFSSNEEKDANKEFEIRRTCSLYRQNLRKCLKDFISSDEEEGANEGESKSQEKSTDEQEGAHPQRWKLSNRFITSFEKLKIKTGRVEKSNDEHEKPHPKRLKSSTSSL